ncbi:hypothetical protein ACU4GH_20320 [Bradyrhizobium betae]
MPLGRDRLELSQGGIPPVVIQSRMAASSRQRLNCRASAPRKAAPIRSRKGAVVASASIILRRVDGLLIPA